MKEIINGRIVTPYEVVEDKVLVIEEDRIIGIKDKASGQGEIIDAGGGYVTPGFIDIHSDKVEQFIQPRKTSQMDFELALKECERELICNGITTIYHSLSLMNDGLLGTAPLRSKDNVKKFADLVCDIHKRMHLIHHRMHLRIEIDNPNAYDIAKDMIEYDLVHEISFMDHTPGQGQYRNLEIYEKCVADYKDSESTTMDQIFDYHKNKKMMTFEQMQNLSSFAHDKNIAVASHDDDTVEKLKVNSGIGVDISEFPITIDVAVKAKKSGFHTVMGAPNILLGGSHSGNLSAAEAIEKECSDILCSDYYPPAILHSIFIMSQKQNIPIYKMVAKATLAPAQAMNIESEYGSIEAGKKADILIINEYDSYPVISAVMVDGKKVLDMEYRR